MAVYDSDGWQMQQEAAFPTELPPQRPSDDDLSVAVEVLRNPFRTFVRADDRDAMSRVADWLEAGP